MGDSQNQNQNQQEKEILKRALRSQRNVGRRLPLMRSTALAVELSDVIFADGNFTAEAMALMPGLLYNFVGRIHVDLYWDSVAMLWQLCPLPLPLSLPSQLPSQNDFDSSFGDGSSNNNNNNNNTPLTGVLPPESGSVSGIGHNAELTGRTAAAEAAEAAAKATNITLGNGIVCSLPRVGLRELLSSISAFMRNASVSDSEMLYPVTVILNLHALNQSNATSSIPADPSLNPAASLGATVAAYSNLFTPTQLAESQASLSPVITSSPYNLVTNASLSNTSFPIVDAITNRIIVGFGRNMLPANTSYQFGNDSQFIFPASMLSGIPVINTSSLLLDPTHSFLESCARPATNIAMRGTGFDITNPTFSVQPPNITNKDTIVSWAFASIQDTHDNPFNSTVMSSIVHCGFALTRTQSASQNMTQNSSQTVDSTDLIWSWDFGEPAMNYTLNCASIQQSSARWNTTDCATVLPVACSDPITDPFTWRVSNTVKRDFPGAVTACTPPLQFSVPRTAQEQAQLVKSMIAANVTAAWINLNRVSPVCWVEGWGSPCPYTFPEDQLFSKLIGANLKQGITILVIFVAFIFYQAHQQLKVSRERRRRAEVRRKITLMEYKSVPKSESS
eukprot:jgi/Hompol1/5080/HPOL_004146-RA